MKYDTFFLQRSSKHGMLLRQKLYTKADACNVYHGANKKIKKRIS